MSGANADLEDGWLATPGPAEEDRLNGPFTRPGWLMRIPPTPGTRQTYHGWTEAGLVDVDVPAGHFTGCTTLTFLAGTGNHGTLWWCPQVGFAREVIGGCGSVYGGVSVYELEAWRVPPLEAIP